MDYSEGQLATPEGFTRFLAVIDGFSNSGEIFSTKQNTALVLIKYLIKNVIGRYNLPYELRSNKKSTFIFLDSGKSLS